MMDLEKVIRLRNVAISIHRKRGWFDLVRFEEEQLHAISNGYQIVFRGILPSPPPGICYDNWSPLKP